MVPFAPAGICRNYTIYAKDALFFTDIKDQNKITTRNDNLSDIKNTLLEKEREKRERNRVNAHICHFNVRSLQSRASIQHVTLMHGCVHTITIISHCASDATHTSAHTNSLMDILKLRPKGYF